MCLKLREVSVIFFLQEVNELLIGDVNFTFLQLLIKTKWEPKDHLIESVLYRKVICVALIRKIKSLFGITVGIPNSR